MTHPDGPTDAAQALIEELLRTAFWLQDTMGAFIEEMPEDSFPGEDNAAVQLVLTEVPRAVRRAVANDPSLPLDLLLGRAGELIDALALRPLEQPLLAGAGALAEPTLRALDAIHVASAVGLHPIEAFVTYDERQAAIARLAGLRTIAPGA